MDNRTRRKSVAIVNNLITHCFRRLALSQGTAAGANTQTTFIMPSRFSSLPNVQGEQVTVTTSGTPVQGPDVKVPAGIEVVILAHPDNTGRISIGNTSALALNTATTSMLLEAGQSLTLLIRNFDNIWFDSTVSTDKVRMFTEQA